MGKLWICTVAVCGWCGCATVSELTATSGMGNAEDGRLLLKRERVTASMSLLGSSVKGIETFYACKQEDERTFRCQRINIELPEDDRENLQSTGPAEAAPAAPQP